MRWALTWRLRLKGGAAGETPMTQPRSFNRGPAALLLFQSLLSLIQRPRSSHISGVRGLRFLSTWWRPVSVWCYGLISLFTPRVYLSPICPSASLRVSTRLSASSLCDDSEGYSRHWDSGSHMLKWHGSTFIKAPLLLFVLRLFIFEDYSTPFYCLPVLRGDHLRVMWVSQVFVR